MTFFPFFPSFQDASARLTLSLSWSPRCFTRGCSWNVGTFPAWVREGPALCIVSGELALTTLLCPSPEWGRTELSPSSSAGNKRKDELGKGKRFFFFFWSPSSVFLLGALESELCSRVARIKLLPSARTRWKANLLELHFWLLLPWSNSLVNLVINQGPKPTAIMRWSTEKKLQRKKPRQWRRHWFDFDSC